MNAEAAGRRIEGGIAPAHTNGSGRLRQASPAREESEEEMSIIRLRIVAALSAFVLVLAACNGAGDATQTTTQPSATTAASATTAESPNTTGTAVATDIEGTLTIWAWEGAIQPLQTVDEAFNEEYPNVTLEYQMQAPADLYQNLQLGITAGSGLPDVSVIEDSHLAQFVELGALADVTDQVGPYVDQVNDYKWEEATLDGRIYA
ncbi:MAG: extracellular solute-binding protein, partial [Acidimicrobiia bacterium]